MNNNIKEDETLDDLQNGYHLIQKKDGFRFGVDAVLLADFANIKSNSKVIDMGTGTGIIPILLYARNKPKSIIGIEIQSDMAEMAERSILYNKLEDSIEIRNMDLKEASSILGKSEFDVVVSNPPYVAQKAGINNPDMKKAVARFELMCTLEDVVQSAKSLLKSGGKFFMVHRSDRLVDIIYTMRNLGMEPKRIRFVHSAYNKKPHLVLIEGVRGGKAELKFMDPLYIYDEKGNYTDEIYRIYGREK